MPTNDTTPETDTSATPAARLLLAAATGDADAHARLRVAFMLAGDCDRANYYRPAGLFRADIAASFDCGCWEADCHCPEVPRAHDCPCCTHTEPDDDHDCPSRACWHSEEVETRYDDSGRLLAVVTSTEGRDSYDIEASQLDYSEAVGDAYSRCIWVYGPCPSCAAALDLLRSIAGLTPEEWDQVETLADDLADEDCNGWSRYGEPTVDEWRAALASAGLAPAEHLAELVASRDSKAAGAALARLLLPA